MSNYMDARSILGSAVTTMEERGKNYDGGRQNLMKTIVDIYNAATGADMSILEGFVFMKCLKMARMLKDPSNMDHYVDDINYTALAAEEYAG